MFGASREKIKNQLKNKNNRISDAFTVANEIEESLRNDKKGSKLKQFITDLADDHRDLLAQEENLSSLDGIKDSIDEAIQKVEEVYSNNAREIEEISRFWTV